MSEYEGYKKRFEAQAAQATTVKSDIAWMAQALRLRVGQIIGAPEEAVELIPLAVQAGQDTGSHSTEKAFKISVEFSPSQYGEAEFKLTPAGSRAVLVEVGKERATIKVSTDTEDPALQLMASQLWQKMRTKLEKKFLR